MQKRVLARARLTPLPLTVSIALASVFALQAATLGAEPAITILDPPESGFFSKQIICKGIPIKAHRDVSDAALREASRRLGRMLEHIPVIVQNLVDIGAEMHIIGKHQVTSDLPYLRHFKGKAYESYGKTFESIDVRTRGIGGLSEMLKVHATRAPLQRNIEPAEVGKAALFLASDLSSGVSGEVLYVDCGYNVVAFASAELEHMKG